MIDFKQMTDDEQTAMAACEEWSNGEPAVTTQEEELSFKEGFKRGLRHERKKWQKFKWRNPLEKYRSKKLTADIYIDDHCLGIPTIFDEKRSKRPFVDWDGVEQLLEMMNVLPATPRTHITVKQPSFQWE